MNRIEKFGLFMTITGICILCALFVLGNGDAAAATRNGEPISYWFPIILLVIGLFLFILPE